MIRRFGFSNFGPYPLLPDDSLHEIDFVAGRVTEHAGHVRPMGPKGEGILPVLGFYGANASGKSAALDAMATMAKLVTSSFSQPSASGRLLRRPFKLDDTSVHAPTTFDAELWLSGVRYRYGFRYDDRQILGEWLHAWPGGVRQVWFQRDEGPQDDWHFGRGWTGPRRGIARQTRSDALLLSTAAALNHPAAGRLQAAFGTWVHSHLDDRAAPRGRLFGRSPLVDPNHKHLLLDLLRAADLGLTDVRIVNVRTRKLSELEQVPEFRDNLAAMFDAQGDPHEIHLQHAGVAGQRYWLEPAEESEGTAMLLLLLHGVLRALARGGLLIVDELDHALHPVLAARVLELFTSPASNPRGAQLAFASHNAALLALLRRDAILLCEKDEEGRASLVTAAEYDLPKRADVEQRYREGRLGAVPRVSSLTTVVAASGVVGAAPG